MRTCMLLLLVATIIFRMKDALAQEPVRAGGSDRIEGKAVDIGAGGGESVWIVGTGPTTGDGNQVYRLVNGKFEPAAGQFGTRIAVSPEGQVWIVNAKNDIWGPHGRVEGKAVDIGAGAGGAVWIVGTGPTDGDGNRIYRLYGDRFAPVAYGYGTEISVTVDGTAWQINKKQDIWRQKEQIPLSFRHDFAVGHVVYRLQPAKHESTVSMNLHGIHEDIAGKTEYRSILILADELGQIIWTSPAAKLEVKGHLTKSKTEEDEAGIYKISTEKLSRVRQGLIVSERGRTPFTNWKEVFKVLQDAFLVYRAMDGDQQALTELVGKHVLPAIN